MMANRLGIDTGGTFCDFVLLDEQGSIRRAKVPSTPSDPSVAIREGLRQLGLDEAPDQATVGTTIATNAVIERRGPRVIYVGNEDFTDVPFIGRLDKERLYDLHWKKPRPLLSRGDCLGVSGRIGHHGDEIDGVGPAALEKLEADLAELVAKDQGDVVIAICLLFSYLNPEHEREVAETVRRLLPDAAVSVSHEVSPVWREYERASTTIADAFVKPVVGEYVERVGEALGVENWNLLASNGGFLRSTAAESRPAQLLLSGLAGGVTGARHFAHAAGFDSVFTLDMGGTSCDIGLIQDGVEQYEPEFDVAFGIPATVPCVSVQTIGAGGGSIAWIDKGGMLRVGPRSAGAEPGPVAYGRGGLDPTITDANLVLGRLSPEYFLGGAMKLDLEAALAAYESLGDQLGMEARQAALATLMIADEEMANAVRLVAVDYGLDPREFALVAFGGAGPLQARSVAARLGITTILVPPAPGLCSAFGSLIAPPRVDRVRTYYANSETLDPDEFIAAVAQLADEAVAELSRSVDTEGAELESFASLRYLGQNFELEVEIVGGSAGSWDALLESFAVEHERQYGFSLPGEPVEVVNLRATVRKPQATDDATSFPDEDVPNESRRVWLGPGEASDVKVYRRSQLAPDEELEGPLIIEETDSTTIAFAGDRVRVDESGVLVLTIPGER